MLMKPGKAYLEHRSDEDYVVKMRKTGFCTALFCGTVVTVIVLFLLLLGFPGLINGGFADFYN